MDWLSIPEVAKRLGISDTTTYGLVARGDLPASGWALRVRRSELDAFVERFRVKAGDLGRGSNQYAGRPTAC